MGVEEAISGAMFFAVDLYEETGRAELHAAQIEAIEAAMLEIWQDAATEGAKTVVDQFKDYYEMETKRDEESLFEQIVQEYIEAYGASAVRQVSATTTAQINALIQEGIEEGLSVADIAKALRAAIPNISRLRAHTIARTETHSASVFGTHQVARRSRRPLVKEWVAADDHRTRDFGEGDGIVDEFSHRAMDGKTAHMDEPFRVPMRNGGTENILFPGDPDASAGNRINCRCVLAYNRAE